MINNFPAKPIYNLGGYVSFNFTPVQFIYSFPAIAAGNCLSAVVFNSGYGWLTGYATRESLAYKENTQFDENGSCYALEVDGFVPGQGAVLADQMASMASQRFVILVTDSAGILRLIGTMTEPLDFTGDFESGALRSDARGYQMKFTGLSSYRSPAYTA